MVVYAHDNFLPLNPLLKKDTNNLVRANPNPVLPLKGQGGY